MFMPIRNSIRALLPFFAENGNNLRQSAAFLATSASKFQQRRETVEQDQGDTVPKIAKVEKNARTNLLTVTWENGKIGKFPFIWLRDMSLDPQTFHLTDNLRARAVHWNQYKPDVQPANLSVNADLNTIQVKWPCGLESSYHSDFLLKRNFIEPQIQENRKSVYFKEKKNLWDSKIIQNEHPRCSWKDVKEYGQIYHDWLVGLAEYGVAVVEDTGANLLTVNDLVDNYIGHTWNSYYGSYWDITPQKTPSNLGYVAGKNLQFHTDLPCYETPPGLLAFHMIKPAKKGGFSHFVDTFKVGETIRQKHPEVFKILSETEIEYIDHGGSEFYQFYMQTRHPVFRLKPNGEIGSMVYSNHMRTWFWDEPPEKIQQIYWALNVFMEICYSPEFLFEIPLKAGEIVIFDNSRVLHSRTGYECDPGENRVVEGCYLSWDVVKSRIRLLKAKLNTPDYTPAF